MRTGGAGSLYVRSDYREPVWCARVCVPFTVDGAIKSRQVSKIVGRVSEMSHEKALWMLGEFRDVALSKFRSRIQREHATRKKSEGQEWRSIGAASELRAAADLMSRGFETFRNLDPCGAFDLVAYSVRYDKFFRVEVKTGSVKCGAPVVSGLKGRVFDLLAVVNSAGAVTYFDRQCTLVLNPANQARVSPGAEAENEAKSA